MTETTRITLPATSLEESGVRLDKWLAQAVPALSRSRLKALITTGQVSQDGLTITDPSAVVKPGVAFSIDLPEPEPARPQGQPIALDVRYEDDHLIIVNKPAGLVVHPAPGNLDQTLVNALIAHCGDSLSGIGGVKRPGIVHRLDKETSGLLVAAKTDAAHRGLARLFATHDIERAYRALIWGVPIPPIGKFSGDIGRDPKHRTRMAVVPEGRGRSALTRYKVLKSWKGAVSLIDCRLETGRTHQIRVHFAHAGHALVGDPVYGGKTRGVRLKNLSDENRLQLQAFPRQALHAFQLGFVHPVDGNYLKFDAPLPQDFNELIFNLDKD
ncbi:MAG: RluA family pseudouridine synthase [Alphaproteobacteria bacterium]|nr:RluA family pseudouridine synthase [Alphaproteobacteria bacterium]